MTADESKWSLRGYLYSKLSFGEAYRRYSLKFSFMVAYVSGAVQREAICHPIKI